MEPAMKQRLLGAAVIVGLAVIILPLLLDGSGTSEIEEIPPPPQPETAQTGPIVSDDRVPLPAAERESPSSPEPAPAPQASVPPPIVMQPKPDSAATAQPTPTPQSAPTPPPAPEAEPAPSEPPVAARPQAPEPEPTTDKPTPAPSAEQSGWVVQVGSFTGRDKAEALSERLQAAGFQGFTDEFTADGKTMYRVRVGPLPERAEAESLQRRIQAEQQLDGYVTQQP